MYVLYIVHNASTSHIVPVRQYNHKRRASSCTASARQTGRSLRNTPAAGARMRQSRKMSHSAGQHQRAQCPAIMGQSTSDGVGLHFAAPPVFADFCKYFHSHQTPPTPSSSSSPSSQPPPSPSPHHLPRSTSHLTLIHPSCIFHSIPPMSHYFKLFSILIISNTTLQFLRKRIHNLTLIQNIHNRVLQNLTNIHSAHFLAPPFILTLSNHLYAVSRPTSINPLFLSNPLHFPI